MVETGKDSDRTKLMLCKVLCILPVIVFGICFLGVLLMICFGEEIPWYLYNLAFDLFIFLALPCFIVSVVACVCAICRKSMCHVVFAVLDIVVCEAWCFVALLALWFRE